MRGGFDPAGLRFRPVVAGGVNVWIRFRTGNKTLSSSVGLALCTRASQSETGYRGLGFHTVRGSVDPEGLRFCPVVAGGVNVWMSFPAMRLYPPRLGWLYVRGPASQRPASGVGDFTPFRAVSKRTREYTVFVAGVSGLSLCEEIHDPGMGPTLPGSALALPAQANQRSANWIGVPTTCGVVKTRENTGFCPRCVGVYEIRWDLIPKDGARSTPGLNSLATPCS